MYLKIILTANSNTFRAHVTLNTSSKYDYSREVYQQDVILYIWSEFMFTNTCLTSVQLSAPIHVLRHLRQYNSFSGIWKYFLGFSVFFVNCKFDRAINLALQLYFKLKFSIIISFCNQSTCF